MRFHGLRTDHSCKLAFTTHAFSQWLAERFTKVRVLEGLNVIINVVSNIACLMSDYDNALGLGLLNHRLERLWIIRNHDNGINILRDEI